MVRRPAFCGKEKRMRKLGLCIITSLIYFFIFATSCFACVGARPMSMGGAFIGVADDASTTYWNPAGLDQKQTEREKVMEDTLEEMSGIKFTYTPTLYNRDEYNYDDFVALTVPVKFRNYDFGVLGFSFINTGYEFELDLGAPLIYTFDRDEHWFWLSYGKNIIGGLSLGVNLRYQEAEEEETLEAMGVTLLSFSDKDHLFALDPALFYKIGRLSLGVLYQNANEPSETLWGVKATYIRNLRAGIAFRPDDHTIIAADVYDALEETKNVPNSVAQDIRVGIERWFDFPEDTPNWIGDSLAIRVGGYHVNRSSRAYTFGLGLKGSDWYRETEWFKSAEIDYAVIYWDESRDFTHQLGLTFNF
jgi:hypothetical protein